MTRWDHWKVRGEFNYRCEALERRQDEQFSEARVEFKNIDNFFEEVRGQMHAMQHNLGHQNEALGHALAATDEIFNAALMGSQDRDLATQAHHSTPQVNQDLHAITLQGTNMDPYFTP